MDNYLIYTDSAADMPAHIYSDYDIRIIPMDYIVNGEIRTFYTDSPDHDKECDALFEAQKNNADVSTTQITPYTYIEKWTPELEAGNDILYICFSSGISATYDNALNAANQLSEDFPDRKIIVIDSLSATQGLGIFVTAALMNRAGGMSIDDNAAWLTENRKYVCHRFMVGDLHYLKKGGRISAASATIGSMLSIKPLLIINDEGKLEVYDKPRGEKMAIKRLVDATKKDLRVDGVPKMIYVGHTSRYKDVEEVAKQVRNAVGPDVLVEICNLSPIIGAHVGPSFFSICSWGFHRKEPK
jgi:DegV family protein with EDD domain